MAQEIHRERTAIRRKTLSAPLKLALKLGLLPPWASVFDYGCGRCDDIRILRRIVREADGWDPYYRPEGLKREADVVNLGYVLNVIESIPERNEVLRHAYSLARHVLIVSVRTDKDIAGTEWGDGLRIPSTGAFQKPYTPLELRNYIADILRIVPPYSNPGIAFVFKNPTDIDRFLTAIRLRGKRGST